jgi:tetratricopeptide (TPR) repeat protein
MLRRLIVAILILPSHFSADTSKLKGQVVLNEFNGQPMANVEVGAAGANPRATDSLGMFTLEFPDKRPGEAVQLVIHKEGFEVVNDVQLETSLPMVPDAKPMTIILCNVGNREEMARRFYRLKSVEAIEASYRKRTEKANSQEMAQLRRERDQALAAAEGSRETSQNQTWPESPTSRSAMRLFLDGKTDEALKALNEEKLRDLAASARERQTAAGKELAEASQAWLFKARLLTTRFQFVEAEKAYRESIEASPESFAANFAYAGFNESLNRHQEARKGYARSLVLARQSGKDADIAGTLNDLGILNSKQNHLEEAGEELQEALKIYRELAGKNPENYLPHVAMTLNNLGILHRQQDRMEDARKELEEGLKIRRELAEKIPVAYLPVVAATLNNLGMLNYSQHRMEDARKELEESLKIRRELMGTNPVKYLPDLASALNNLGVLDLYENRSEEALEELQEALKIYRDLAARNPEAHMPDLANTLNNIGQLDVKLNRTEEARKEFEEALKIRRELVDLASTLKNLGFLDFDRNRHGEETRKELEETVKILRELVGKSPEIYLPELASTLNNLGIIDSGENRNEEARRKFEEVLKIYRGLAAKNPQTYQSQVANTLSNLGVLNSDENRLEEARSEYVEALKIYQGLAEQDPAQFQPSVDKLLRQLEELSK